MKRVIFHPRAREDLRAFPGVIKNKIGKALFQLQQGEKIGLPLSRPMPSVAPGVEELRVKDESGIYRAFYFTRSVEGIFVSHVFAKKTMKTSPLDMELGRKRLKELLK
jgi:phage-related protein